MNLKKLAEGEVESSRYLSVGIYGQSAQDFKTTSNEIYRRELIVTSTAGIVDTVRNVTDQPGTGVLPGEIHAGFYYNDKYKLQFGDNIVLSPGQNIRTPPNRKFCKMRPIFLWGGLLPGH